MDEIVVPTTRVMLWTVPRSCSSVFERSVRELPTVKVFYEPHSAPFLYGPERPHRLNLPQEVLKKYENQTYEQVDNMLLAEYQSYGAVFVKNMSFFIPKERYSQTMYSTFKHTFLIRNPHQAIPSFWKVSKTNGHSFPGLAGDAYSKLCELFELASSSAEEVLVIDADDLMSNPKLIMKEYCMKTNLPYDDSMLTWTPGIVKDWTANPYYKAWHWNAMYSSGFNKEMPKPKEIAESYPQEVHDLIAKAMPYYEVMRKHSFNSKH